MQHSIRSSLRLSQARAMSNGRYTLPQLKGEPFLHYREGSAERMHLQASLKKMKSEIVEIPCVVNGKEHFTGKTIIAISIRIIYINL